MKDPKKIAHIVAHYNCDKTGREIADHLGIHRSSLVRIVNELKTQGHPIRSAVPDHKTIAIVLECFGNIPSAQLAGMIGMTYKQLRAFVQYIRDIGIIVRPGYAQCATSTGREHPEKISSSKRRDNRYKGTKGDHRVDNNHNPEVVQIPSQKTGGRMVLIREHPATWVWRSF